MTGKYAFIGDNSLYIDWSLQKNGVGLLFWLVGELKSKTMISVSLYGGQNMQLSVLGG